MIKLWDLHQPYATGRLIKRYKRFLADVQLPSGEKITAYCPNPGRMLGCSEPGSLVRLSHLGEGKRRYPYRLDLVNHNGVWVGVNPSLANKLVFSGIQQGLLFSELDPLLWQKEVSYSEGRRIDFLHSGPHGQVFVEVKSVSYLDHGQGFFPDAVSKRATHHLASLIAMIQQGHRAAVVYCVQRSDIVSVQPAEHIDPAYAEAYHRAVSAGVSFIVFRTRVATDGHAIYAQT
jgi:sugar fermentation stimulation protein A